MYFCNYKIFRLFFCKNFTFLPFENPRLSSSQPFLYLTFILFFFRHCVLHFLYDADVELFEGGEFYLGIVGDGGVPRCFGEICGEVGGGELVAVAGVDFVAHQAQKALGITVQMAFHYDFLVGELPAALVGVEVGAELNPKFVGNGRF